MVRGASHHSEHLCDDPIRYSWVEEVRHGVDEDPATTPPTQGLVEPAGEKADKPGPLPVGDRAGVGVEMLQPPAISNRVTVVASG
jgi:hypothetical protein